MDECAVLFLLFTFRRNVDGAQIRGGFEIPVCVKKGPML
jgi:hypothetical protein